MTNNFEALDIYPTLSDEELQNIVGVGNFFKEAGKFIDGFGAGL